MLFNTTYGKSRFCKLPMWRRQLVKAAVFKPFSASIFFSSEMEKIIVEIAASSDLIHVNRLNMALHIESLLSKKLNGKHFILDLDDIETVFKRRMLQAYPPSRWQKKVFEYFDLLKLWQYQRKLLQSFDRVFVCSKQDKAYFGNNEKIIIIPNGTNVSSNILPEESDSKTLLFIGTLSYLPNTEGIFFFLKEIFPLIQKEITGVRLIIVGSNPPPNISELHDGRTIWVEGNVPSVEKYYMQATISIVPLIVGAGTRVKILEAFSLGKPVVTTSIGCEGLEVENGKHLFIADEPKIFASSCVSLLRSPQLRRKMILQARKLVEQNYRWDFIQTRVENSVRELLEERSN